jgi:hypothetical protein
MRRPILFLLACGSLLHADPSLSSSGVGTCAFGLADNFTALADDFSALYWNPAGLAFVLTREVHCEVAFDHSSSATRFDGGPTNALQERVLLNSAGLMQSVPTVRGGFGFAIGYSSPILLDAIGDYQGPGVYRGVPAAGAHDTLDSGETLQFDKQRWQDKGSCRLWGAGVGWQVAPGLGIGLSWGLLFGDERVDYENLSRTDKGIFLDFTRKVSREYLVGYDVRMGVLYKPRDNLSFGFRLVLPRRVRTGETENYYDAVTDENIITKRWGVMTSGFSGATGMAWKMPWVTLTSDLVFRAPLSHAPAASDLAHWRAGAGLGVEIPLRWMASIVRAGYSRRHGDLSAMQLWWDGSGPDPADPVTLVRDWRLLTAGYTLFIGKTVSFDIAYGNLTHTLSTSYADWQSPMVEDHSLQQGTVTLSIRY